tara:strand:+ start:100 stop:579 length:480 start_codon:yes stop_codon:yes gene_type:complete
MQSDHSEFRSEKHELDIIVLCDDLSSPANIGGVLRLADAYGVSKVVFLGGEENITPRAKSVARGTQNYVNYEFKSKLEDMDLEDREWICIELANNSNPLSDLKLSSSKIGMIIGNENTGVSAIWLEKFPVFHIKMFGNNSSMNVTNALSAGLYQITNHF